ncbi:DUF3048 domain-containing protein [Candidatus Peregrinibacteria bacterium]|nr:DUF3048 domain-containing protein [Candidatus Peregrinibacteria bacterium]
MTIPTPSSRSRMMFRSRPFIALLIACIGIASVLAYRSFGPEPAHTPLPGIQAENPGGFLSRLSLIPSAWRKRSLVSVIIENHERARPYHQGLEDALMIFEMPVEGFITRFNVLYDLKKLPKLIGPVRSLRPYFLDAFLPWGPPQIHAGGSPEAFARVQEIGIVFAVNGLAHDKEFMRDDGIAAPHNLFIDDKGLESLLTNATAKTLRWPPYHVGAAPSGSGALKISINLLNITNNISYAYDFFTQSYERTNGFTVSRAQPKNVLLLEIPVTNIGSFGRLEISVTGEGKALLFRSGTVQHGRWKKRSTDQWFTFEDKHGQPLVFAQGLTWITAQPTLERVKWEDSL